MKDTKTNSILTTIVVSALTYFIMDAFKIKQERVYRYAAGESDYERTHPKKSIKTRV